MSPIPNPPDSPPSASVSSAPTPTPNPSSANDEEGLRRLAELRETFYALYAEDPSYAIGRLDMIIEDLRKQLEECRRKVDEEKSN